MPRSTSGNRHRPASAAAGAPPRALPDLHIARRPGGPPWPSGRHIGAAAIALSAVTHACLIGFALHHRWGAELPPPLVIELGIVVDRPLTFVTTAEPAAPAHEIAMEATAAAVPATPLIADIAPLPAAPSPTAPVTPAKAQPTAVTSAPDRAPAGPAAEVAAAAPPARAASPMAAAAAPPAPAVASTTERTVETPPETVGEMRATAVGSALEPRQHAAAAPLQDVQIRATAIAPRAGYSTDPAAIHPVGGAVPLEAARPADRQSTIPAADRGRAVESAPPPTERAPAADQPAEVRVALATPTAARAVADDEVAASPPVKPVGQPVAVGAAPSLPPISGRSHAPAPEPVAGATAPPATVMGAGLTAARRAAPASSPPPAAGVAHEAAATPATTAAGPISGVTVGADGSTTSPSDPIAGAAALPPSIVNVFPGSKGPTMSPTGGLGSARPSHAAAAAPAEAPVGPARPITAEGNRLPMIEAMLNEPTATELAAAIRRSLGDLGCGRLAVTSDAQRRVEIAGLYPEDLDRDQIVRQIEASGARSPVLDLKPISGELCAAVRLAEEAAAPGAQPTLTFNHADGAFHEGDWAVFEIGVPAAVGKGYLYVAFLDPIGRVVTLYPTSATDLPAVRGGDELRLGRAKGDAGGSGTYYELEPPFGTGLVFVIVSPVLMPGLAVAQMRPLPAYLDALRRNLDQAKGHGPIFVALRTLDMLPR